MKLIVDIPDEIRDYVDHYIPIGDGKHYCYLDEIVKMIKNGVPAEEMISMSAIREIENDIIEYGYNHDHLIGLDFYRVVDKRVKEHKI